MANGKLMVNLNQDNEEKIFVERFLGGREFTALCTGDDQLGVLVYQVAERVFNQKLTSRERILAFDKYWDGYDLEGHMPDLNKENSLY